MRFSPSDRMLQLGIVPAVTSWIKESFPSSSASVWQRGAKSEHRRIVAAVQDVAADGVLARQGHAVLSLAALLIGFYKAAPDDVVFGAADFDRMVDVCLATAIVCMTFAGAEPLSDAGIRELERLLEPGRSRGTETYWEGNLRLEGEPKTPGQTLVCSVTRCGLRSLCIREKCLFLLRHLCKIEAAQARFNGCRLSVAACMAGGSPACELRLARR